MKTPKRLLPLLPALTAALGLMINATAPAQTFQVLYTFPAASTGARFDNGAGANPSGGLILSGNTLYGTTVEGGNNTDAGTLFDLNTNGSNFTAFLIFTANTTEYNPDAGLVLSGNTLFGTTEGGASYSGMVFAANANGAITNLHTFAPGMIEQFNISQYRIVTNTDGVGPRSTLVLSQNVLYGTTETGGTNANGTVFAVDSNGSNFVNLHIFSGTSGAGTNYDGVFPFGGLALSGNMLYGTAAYGGTHGNGTVFAINTNTGVFTNLYNFTNGTDGAAPYAGVVVSGNKLYGTASYGGTAGNGTIFALNTDGTGFTNLHSFSAAAVNTNTGYSTNSDGTGPQGPLTISGTTLYGTAPSCGANGSGTIFKLNTDGSGFTTLYSLSTIALNSANSIYTNSDGFGVTSGLVLSGNTLYGTADNGGQNDFGTIFSLSLPTGPQLSTIHSGTNLVITWPTNATGFTLESVTNLGSTNWSTVSPPPVVINGQNTVTNAISGAKKFYRLYQ
jgi:uncharacterized repeat protein (TIGR03803 family)